MVDHRLGAGRHRPPLAGLVRRPGTDRPVPAGRSARSVDPRALGKPVTALRLADAAEHDSFTELVPDGSTMQSYRALLAMLLCRDGVEQMRADAKAAVAGLSLASQWRTLALLLEGILHLLDGEAGRADQVLADAVEVGTRTGALPGAAVALASPRAARRWSAPGSSASASRPRQRLVGNGTPRAPVPGWDRRPCRARRPARSAAGGR